MFNTFLPLRNDAFYMNPYTGSVDSSAGWRSDFESTLNNCSKFSEYYEEARTLFLNNTEILEEEADTYALKTTWEFWGGDSLIEVKSDEEGNWIEVE